MTTDCAVNTVDVAGGRLAYRRWQGVQDRSPLFALHGFTGSSQSWQAIATQLTVGRSVYAIDLPGHGLTELGTPQRPCDMAQFANAFCDALDALEIESFDLLGYSLGGRSALCIALEGRRRPRRLVLESAGPGLAEPAQRAARVNDDETLARFIEDNDLATFVERWERTPVLASQKSLPAAQAERLRESRLACSRSGLAMSLRGMGTGAQPYVGEALPTLAIPVLCLAGARDAKFLSLAQWMTERLPQARCRICAEAGHSVHLEAPQWYAATVEDFLSTDAEQPAPSAGA